MKILLATLLLALSLTGATRAQSPSDPHPPLAVKTFYLTNINTPSDAEAITNALRFALSISSPIYIPAQNALIVRGTAEQLAQVQQVLSSLDRPKRAYRLSYTISDFEADHLVGKQHFSMVVVSGGRTTLKQGSKSPIVSGSSDSSKDSSQTQFTYLDIGTNFDVSLDDFVDGMRLRSKIERSSIPDEKTIAGITEPIVRQSVLEGTSLLIPGKPLVLGSMDVPYSNRRSEIEVVMDPVK